MNSVTFSVYFFICLFLNSALLNRYKTFWSYAECTDTLIFGILVMEQNDPDGWLGGVGVMAYQPL